MGDDDLARSFIENYELLSVLHAENIHVDLSNETAEGHHCIIAIKSNF